MSVYASICRIHCSDLIPNRNLTSMCSQLSHEGSHESSQLIDEVIQSSRGSHQYSCGGSCGSRQFSRGDSQSSSGSSQCNSLSNCGASQLSHGSGCSTRGKSTTIASTCISVNRFYSSSQHACTSSKRLIAFHHEEYYDDWPLIGEVIEEKIDFF